MLSSPSVIFNAASMSCCWGQEKSYQIYVHEIEAKVITSYTNNLLFAFFAVLVQLLPAVRDALALGPSGCAL